MTETKPSAPAARTAADIAAQKTRNIWLAVALLGFVVLVGVTSAIRIQSIDFSKTEGFYLDGSLQKESAPPPDLEAMSDTPEGQTP